MIRLIILLATLAIALPFVIAKGALPFGTAVSRRGAFSSGRRMMETRASHLPEAKTGDKLERVRQLCGCHAHADLAGAMRDTSFPLDIVYLVCLGLFLGNGERNPARPHGRPSFLSHIPIWVCWLLPCVYIACDLSEDLLIVLPDPAGDNRRRRVPGTFARAQRQHCVGRPRVHLGRVAISVSNIWPAATKL